MSFKRTAATVALVIAATAGPADACRMAAPLNLEDVRYADAVVIGRIVDYHVVRDVESRRKMLANPKLPRDLRRYYQGRNGLLSDYARFTVKTASVLVGQAAERFAVTWDNSTFAEPETMPTGPYVIALRRPSSPMPPLRGPSATIVLKPDGLTLLQAPCSTPFLFKSGSEEAREVIRLTQANLFSPAQ